MSRLAVRPACEKGRRGRQDARFGGSEFGGSVVTFVIALPLLLTFLCAVLDLGRTVFLHIAIDDAAHAACRVAASVPVGSASEQAVRAASLAASPALASNDLRLTATVDYGEAESVSYPHHVYDGAAGGFEELPAEARRRRVNVSVRLEGSYLTPFGTLLSAAAGRDDSGFSYRAESTGYVDATVEEGLW